MGVEHTFAATVGLTAVMTGFGLIAMVCMLAVIDDLVEDMVAEPTWAKKVKTPPKKKQLSKG